MAWRVPSFLDEPLTLIGCFDPSVESSVDSQGEHFCARPGILMDAQHAADEESEITAVLGWKRAGEELIVVDCFTEFSRGFFPRGRLAGHHAMKHGSEGPDLRFGGEGVCVPFDFLLGRKPF